MQFSFGKGLLRAAMLLGFLGCLMAQGSLCGAAATSEPRAVTTELRADTSGPALRSNGFDSIATGRVEIGMPDEFGVALEDEDSIEMFRFDVQQRTFGVDRTVRAAKAGPKIARNTRVSISPPLLV